MDHLTVDLGAVLGPAPELLGVHIPVETIGPVGSELAEVAVRDSARPTRVGLAWPARAADALAKISDGAVRELRHEFRDGHGRAGSAPALIPFPPPTPVAMTARPAHDPPTLFVLSTAHARNCLSSYLSALYPYQGADGSGHRQLCRSRPSEDRCSRGHRWMPG